METILVNSIILEFNNYKLKETMNHNFSNHYKKSEMKTYEEQLHKFKIIIRK